MLSDPNYNWYLAIRIVAPLPSRVDGSVQTEYARDILLRQHPGAKISDEFSLSAANSPGPAFDAQWEGVSGTVQSTRVAFIPFPVGILEFSLLSKPEKFTQGKYFLNFLLLTFRSNEGGNLDMPVFSGKS